MEMETGYWHGGSGQAGQGRQVRSGHESVKLPTSRLIGVAARALLTGQAVFAPSAASANSSAVIPGTVPLTFRTIPVIPVPGWKVTSAEVSIAVGGVPALASAFESYLAGTLDE